MSSDISLVKFISITSVFYFLSYVVHLGNKRRFFLNKLNVTLFENDLAILKVKNPEFLECRKKIIWPACLPNKVFSNIVYKSSMICLEL